MHADNDNELPMFVNGSPTIAAFTRIRNATPAMLAAEAEYAEYAERLSRPMAPLPWRQRLRRKILGKPWTDPFALLGLHIFLNILIRPWYWPAAAWHLWKTRKRNSLWEGRNPPEKH